MTSTQILWIVLLPAIALIPALVFGGRHRRRDKRKRISGDSGAWGASVPADSGPAGFDGGCASGGGDCGGSD